MIEKHYYKDEVIKDYQFEVPFCMPNTVNSLEAVYELPEFDLEKQQDMINNPWKTQSDSFYFVNDKLIMHNKAQYSYAPFDEQQWRNENEMLAIPTNKDKRSHYRNLLRTVHIIKDKYGKLVEITK